MFDDNFFAYDAENGLLCSIMIDNDLMDKVGDIIEAKHFHDVSNQIIFEAMTRIYKRRLGKIDLITLTNELKSAGKLNDIGGVLKITALGQAVYSSVNAMSYANILLEKYRRREEWNLGKKCIGISKGSGEVEEIEKAFNAFLNLEDSGNECENAFDAFSKAHDELWAKAEGKTIAGLSSGFNKLDMQIGGFVGGRLYVAAARPGVGKTSFAVNIINQICSKGGVVVMASLEMTHQQIAERIITMRMEHKMEELKEDESKRNEITEAFGSFSIDNLFFTPGFQLTVSKLRGLVRQVMRKSGKVSLVVIDYLQLMNSEKESGNREQEVSKLSRETKELAMELNVPVLLLSQLNRSVETRQDKHPVLSDLRDSGAIEQDADVVMLLYRDEYYYPETKNKNILEINVTKQRHGPTGKVYLYYSKSRQAMRTL